MQTDGITADQVTADVIAGYGDPGVTAGNLSVDLTRSGGHVGWSTQPSP